jgi:hypothetical protein
MERYTPEFVRAEVDKDIDRLFALYAVGRSPNWMCDQATKNLVTVGNWLAEELTRLGCSDKDRIEQQQFYNRLSRSKEAVWWIAATALNQVLDGKVPQNRRPHRRWG